MKISIVIAAYNRAYIIRKALDSALAQTYQNFEIIVVDDGSADKTADVVAAYASRNIRYIRHNNNRGCSAAYNTGINAAAGDAITLLDSDDRWEPDNLERQVNFLERHPEVEVVFTDVTVVGAEKSIPSLIALMPVFSRLVNGKQKGVECVLSSREMYLCLLQEVPVKPTAALIRREMFSKAGMFNERWPSGTDWDLFLRFSRSASFGYIDAPLSIQVRTPDATHRKYAEKDKLFLLELFAKEKLRLKDDKEATTAANHGIRQHCDNLAFHYLSSGQKMQSISTYLRGYKETHEARMLLRAGAALMPVKLRDTLKTLVKKPAVSA
jgi:glycosyltransferase involved in cell wall biosynthesis